MYAYIYICIHTYICRDILYIYMYIPHMCIYDMYTRIHANLHECISVHAVRCDAMLCMLNHAMQCCAMLFYASVCSVLFCFGVFVGLGYATLCYDICLCRLGCCIISCAIHILISLVYMLMFTFMHVLVGFSSCSSLRGVVPLKKGSIVGGPGSPGARF